MEKFMRNFIGISVSFLVTVALLLMFINSKFLFVLVESSDYPQFFSVGVFIALPIVFSIFILTILKIHVLSPSYMDITEMITEFIGIVVLLSTSFGISVDKGLIGQNIAFFLMLLFVYKSSNELAIMFRKRRNN